MGTIGATDWKEARTKELSALVGAASAQCASTDDAMTFRIETTMDEIVDVVLTAREQTSQLCRIEAIWSIRLPPNFNRSTSFEILAAQ
jgi:hypothetical protein